MSLYAKRGVSAQKEDVHKATQNIDKGLYPRAFCKVYADLLGGDEEWVNVMHADGAGTKSILAYLYWKETGDLSVWKGIAQDAIVMNLDDLLCAGIYDSLLFSSAIDRNKSVIPADVLQALIEGSQEFLDQMETFGVHIAFLGGETADVGDAVRTITVNGTMAARWRKSSLVTNEGIAPGNVIVGLASSGQAAWESAYNSGIGSNGLTSARHDLLHKDYAARFPETFEPSLDSGVVYSGTHRLLDKVKVEYGGTTFEQTVGQLALAPTRTYAPVMKRLLADQFGAISGLIHCSGGGQTKCMKYMPDGVLVIKDNLFEVPPVFRLIQESSGADNREMYQVFNMGCRMEIYTDPMAADELVAVARSFGLEAQVIGRVERGEAKQLLLKMGEEDIWY